MSVRIHCPYCNQNYVMEQLQEGFQVQCSKCGKAFTVTSKLLNTNLPTAQANVSTPAAQKLQKKQRPALTTLFIIYGILSIIGGFACAFVPVYADCAEMTMPLILSGCFFLGASQFVSFIGDIREHVMKQTELLEELLKSVK